MLITTHCIEDTSTLLHFDRDFVPFAEHLAARRACSELAPESSAPRRKSLTSLEWKPVD